MVKKAVLDRFVKLGGYEIVRKGQNGTWKNVSEAARKTGLHRMTVYRLLKEHPERPDKTIAKYVEEFEKSEGWNRCVAMYKREAFFPDLKYPILEAWKLLNKKDPISWSEEDFRKIWNSEKFLDSVTNFVEFHHSIMFRRLMRAIDRHDLLAKFKTKARPSGGKKLWYLTEDNIMALVPAINNADLLIFTLRGITEGSRKGALMSTTPEKINFKESVLMVYESKIKKWVEKVHTDAVMELIKRYIEDFKIKGKKRLHPMSQDHYYQVLRLAGRRAGIEKTVSPHILKHTFVSQAHAHGVSAETVVDQAHTELRTLVAFYRASDEKKRRHELRGEEYDVMPFHEWVSYVAMIFAQRYEELTT